jgi:hypothetical protein
LGKDLDWKNCVAHKRWKGERQANAKRLRTVHTGSPREEAQQIGIEGVYPKKTMVMG